MKLGKLPWKKVGAHTAKAIVGQVEIWRGRLPDNDEPNPIYVIIGPDKTWSSLSAVAAQSVLDGLFRTKSSRKVTRKQPTHQLGSRQ